MGEAYVIASHPRREYFNPLALCEPNKLRGVLAGRYTTLAVGVLVTTSTAMTDRSDWAGRWAAGGVEVVGENDAAYYRVRDDYTDVGPHVLAMVAAVAPDAPEHFASEFVRHRLHAVQVGNAVFQGRSDSLRQALEQRVGPSWTKAYKQAAREWPTFARPDADG